VTGPGAAAPGIMSTMSSVAVTITSAVAAHTAGLIVTFCAAGPFTTAGPCRIDGAFVNVGTFRSLLLTSMSMVTRMTLVITTILMMMFRSWRWLGGSSPRCGYGQ